VQANLFGIEKADANVTGAQAKAKLLAPDAAMLPQCMVEPVALGAIRKQTEFERSLADYFFACVANDAYKTIVDVEVTAAIELRYGLHERARLKCLRKAFRGVERSHTDPLTNSSLVAIVHSLVHTFQRFGGRNGLSGRITQAAKSLGDRTYSICLGCRNREEKSDGILHHDRRSGNSYCPAPPVNTYCFT
jgi:hypothetical protein